MDDTKKTNLQAVIEPAEVWHLAQGVAFELAARFVMEAKADDAAAGSLNEFSTRVLEKLTGLKNGSFDTFYRSSDRPVSGDGRRPNVRFDDSRNLPLIEWPITAGTNSWGMVDIDGGEGPDMVLAAPFRPMSLERFPAGSVIVKLQDPHHAATAALVEILQCARRDAESSFLIANGRAAWRRLNSIIGVYRNAARAGINVLGDDDFINWRPDMPLQVEISTAASLIVRIAATSRAQCTVATHLMATWLQVLADSLETLPHLERQSVFVRRLKEASEGVEKSLEGMNTALARANWTSPDPYSCMVVMRPVPESIPILAVVPGEPDKIARIRAHRRR